MAWHALLLLSFFLCLWWARTHAPATGWEEKNMAAESVRE